MLASLESLSISQWIATSDWGYPLLLSVHSMGMAIVVGLLVMLDLRVLGLAKSLPLSMFARLIPFTWFGFALNLVSGMLLFMSMASRLAVNWPFLSKLVAIVIGGMITWALWRSILADAEGRSAATINGGGGVALRGIDASLVSPRTRVLAVLSLATWFGAILFGRLIAYVLDAAILNGDL